ncbi:unnamed protein product [Dicrocoelium dendriticum]|nr:unnamed protein product [Dicrocoelium dendriticum]
MYPADKSNHANADTDIGPGTFALHSEPSLESYCNMDSWSEPGSEDLVFRPVMRRRRAQPPRGKLRCGTQYWNRNLSNADDQLDTAEVTEDAVDLERLQREKVLEAMSRTSWWLWPFAQFFRLLGTIFCTYKIEIGLRGKLRKALGDPTKMLRQNIYGLFIGILMGFGAYLLFLLTFSNNPRLSTLLSAYFMLVSVFGIAFSEDFRCIALLTVPYLAASREKRAVSQGLIATVPLIGTETWEYKKLSSFTWTNSEKRKAFRSFVILFMWMTTLLVVLFADYVMYEVLTTITPVFSEEFSTFGAKSSMGDDYLSAEAGASAPRITGTSSYANVVRALLGMLNPIKDVALNVDAAACKPTATPPNAKTNGSVVIMLVFTLLSIFFEVYVLRLRHLILIWYYPNRGMQRAAWLRTHIRNNRGLFHRLIHKMRTVDVKPGRQAPKTTRLGRMMNRSPWFRRFMQFFGIKRVMCSYCGEEGNPSKKAVFEDNFSRCVECGGYYCRVCQVDLDNICMICRTPLFALSVEVDFEQFSSDEEFDAICARYLRRAEQTTIRARKNQSGGERSRISIKRRA